jgi:RHS repeat-associated protein
LTDRQGSVRDITDNTGAVQDTISYDGWGNVLSETHPAWGDRYKWTGRELDNQTGLQYNRARWYDPTTGRWTSQDPLGFEAGDSNLYRYVMNEQRSLTDPSGLQRWNTQISTGLTKEPSFWALLDNLNDKEWDRVTEALQIARVAVRQAFHDVQAARFKTYKKEYPWKTTLVSYDCWGNPTEHPPPNLEGIQLTNPDTTMKRLELWFGNRQSLTPKQLDRIAGRLLAAYDRLSSGKTEYKLQITKDDSGIADEEGPAYVTFNWIYLRPEFFQNWPLKSQATMLIHEITHLYSPGLGRTSDYGYYGSSIDWFGARGPTYRKGGVGVTLTPAQLIDNADTYAGFIRQYYIGR